MSPRRDIHDRSPCWVRWEKSVSYSMKLSTFGYSVDISSRHICLWILAFAELVHSMSWCLVVYSILYHTAIPLLILAYLLESTSHLHSPSKILSIGWWTIWPHLKLPLLHAKIHSESFCSLSQNLLWRCRTQ